MNSNTSTAICATVAALAFAALCYFGMASINVAHENGTQRIEECVSNDGTWLARTGDCIK